VRFLIKNLTSFSLSVWVKSGQKSESGYRL